MDYLGKWALVTGASAGIGEAFAKALAKRGANIVLVARREDRLNQIAEEVKGAWGVHVHVLPADLATPETPDKIKGELDKAGIEIDLLINNAGYGLPGLFVENSWNVHRDFIELMISSYVHLSYLLLPHMVSKGYGRVINVSSVAGLIPGSPGHTLYGPSKAFLVSFSEALAAEHREQGVHVTALCPGFTYTEFHDVNNTREQVAKLPAFMFMEAEPVVEGAIAAVERGTVVYVPGLWNKCITALIGSFPRSMSGYLIRRYAQNVRGNQPTYSNE